MRKLRDDERDLILLLLKDSQILKINLEEIPNKIVQELNDGGMGSLKFVYNDKKTRRFLKELASVSIMDIDNVPVSFALNIDNFEDLFELDVFKADFSQLKQFPIPPYKVLTSSENL